MTQPLAPELFWTAAAAALTACLWLPNILRLIAEIGVLGALRDGQGGQLIPVPWAQRAKRAHTNAVENLAVFAPLAIAVHVAGAGTATTAAACAVFVAARAAHYVVYTLGLPALRTVFFLAGFACQMVLAAALLAR